jgi:hypothetical protein
LLDSLHDLRQCNPVRFYQKMDVVWHQNISVHVESIALVISLQEVLVPNEVAGIPESSALLVSAGYNMEEGAWKVNARWPGHSTAYTAIWFRKARIKL